MVQTTDNIPGELRERRQWVCYKLVPSTDDPSRMIKLPVNWNGGANARTDDSGTWGSYDQAIGASKRYKGIGFVIAPDDPYCVVDLDDCVDADGNISPDAARIVRSLNSYSEFSLSGRGIHIICRAAKPGPRCRTNKFPGIEIYDNRRFLVMTGVLVPGAPDTIEPAANEIAELYHRIFADAWECQDRDGDTTKPTRVAAAGDSNLNTDADLLDRALKAKNGPQFSRLYNGDLSDYNYDWSAADQALCNMLAFWTARDADRMDRLFRQSGLMRDKWDKTRGHTTYGQRTIQNAIASTNEVYAPRDHAELATDAELAEVLNISGHNRNGKGKGDGSTNRNGNGNKGILAYNHTDYGTAERIVSTFGDHIHYDCDSGRWLVWTGQHWAEDKTGQIERMAKSVIRAMYTELPKIEDPKVRDAAYKYLKNSEQIARIRAAIALAQTEPNIPVLSADMDSDPWALNCPNGIVDLRTGRLSDHDPAKLNTNITSIVYDPKAKCPVWEKFLFEIFDNDAELVQFAQQAVGYSLTGDTREQLFFILYGHGSNGKSTFLSIMRELGGSYATNTSTDTLLDRNNSGIPNDIARLRNVRMVTASETKAGRRLAEELIKQLTGGDPVTARFLHNEFFDFIPKFKLWLACNHQPRIDGQDSGMWRRVRLIPFNVRFQDHDCPEGPYKDKTLPDRLRAELPGILAWAVSGCLDWQKNGLGKPAAVVAATGRYQQNMDVLGEFIATSCVCMPGAKTKSSELYSAYSEWSERNREKPLSQKMFSLRLEERDQFVKRPYHGAFYWHGIGLVNIQQTDDLDPENGPEMDNRPEKDEPINIWYLDTDDDN